MITDTKMLVTLFKVFFKIGAFTLGGGYAMIPIIESEVVNKHAWLTKEEFLDLLAIAQSCPGVFAINIATSIGYKLGGQKAALYATLACALPSFIIILFIAMIFRHFMDIAWVAAMFNLARTAHITWSNAWIPVACALLIWALHVNPIWIIIVAGTGGFVYGKLAKRNA